MKKSMKWLVTLAVALAVIGAGATTASARPYGPPHHHHHHHHGFGPVEFIGAMALGGLAVGVADAYYRASYAPPPPPPEPVVVQRTVVTQPVVTQPVVVQQVAADGQVVGTTTTTGQPVVQTVTQPVVVQQTYPAPVRTVTTYRYVY